MTTHLVPPGPLRTRSAQSLAAERAAEADSARTLDSAVIEAIVEAGFARYFTPQRWGGNAGTFTELTESIADMGEACTSAAWCASLAAYGARQAAYLPEDGQREVWANGPDTLFVGAVVPTGHAEAVPGGGWRLHGTWSYVSAISFAEYAIVAAQVKTDQGPDVRYFAVPPTAYQVQDTWFTVGMRGTGSNTIVIDEVLVPEHLSFARSQLIAGQPVGTLATCHTAGLLSVTAMPFTAPVLGAARGAVRAAVELLAAKREKAAVQVELSRAAGEVDAAALLLGRVTSVLDQGTVQPALAARNGRPALRAIALGVLSSRISSSEITTPYSCLRRAAVSSSASESSG